MERQQKTRSVVQNRTIPPPEHVESSHVAKATLFFRQGRSSSPDAEGSDREETGGFSSVSAPPRSEDTGEDEAPPGEAKVGACFVGVTYGQATAGDAGESSRRRGRGCRRGRAGRHVAFLASCARGCARAGRRARYRGGVHRRRMHQRRSAGCTGCFVRRSVVRDRVGTRTLVGRDNRAGCGCHRQLRLGSRFCSR